MYVYLRIYICLYVSACTYVSLCMACRREDDGGVGSSVQSPSVAGQTKRASDKNEEGEGGEEEKKGEEGREEEVKAEGQRGLDKTGQRNLNLEREEEATLLLQMLQRAVGFNAQYTELRRHTSAFEGKPLIGRRKKSVWPLSLSFSIC